MVALLLAGSIGAVEGVEHHARHVRRGHERGRQPNYVREVDDGASWHAKQVRLCERGVVTSREQRPENLVFGKESGKRRNSGNRQRGRPHQREGPRQIRTQPSHIAHVLRVVVAPGVVIGAVHREDHRP